MKCTVAVAALMLVAGSSAALAQRRTEYASFGWATNGKWQMKFVPATTGEITINIKWKNATSVMGQTLPRRWGISLVREGAPGNANLVQPLPQAVASTAGDVSGAVTLKYDVTAADLASPNAWLASPIADGGSSGQGFELFMSVTYPLPAIDAPFDFALVSVENQLHTSMGISTLYANVKNVGRQSVTNTFPVQCRLNSFRFHGSPFVYSTSSWLPGTTIRVALEQRPQTHSLHPGADTAFIDPGRNLSVGSHSVACEISTHPPQKDYYPDNDSIQVQVIVPPPEPAKLTIDATVDDCKGGRMLVAGQRACGYVDWVNKGGGFDGGFTATCQQGGQRGTAVKTGRTRSGDKGRTDFDPGSMATGPHIMICTLQTAGGFTVQSTDTIVVKPPQRSDLALAAIDRVVDDWTGTPRLIVWLRNDGTVEEGSNLVDCVIAGHHFTNRYASVGAGALQQISTINPLALASLPEGLHQATCTVTVGAASAPDVNPANNTMSAAVRITHPGHEPYVALRRAKASLEKSHPHHDILAQSGSTIDEAMLRIEVEIVSTAPPRAPVFLICVKDEAGADLAAHIQAERVLSRNITIGNTAYYFPNPVGRVTWIDATVTPPARGIIHVEAWDSANAPPAGSPCNATKDPLASPVAPPQTGLWSMAEFPAKFDWRMPDTFVKKGQLDRIIGEAPLISSSDTTPPITSRRSSGPTRNAPKVASKKIAPPRADSGEAPPVKVPAGTFRITLPTGVVRGEASFICQLTETTSQVAVTLGGEGLLGAIVGKVRGVGAGTYEITEDDTRGVTVGFAHLKLPIASYPATSGTLTITEWTGKVIRGSFQYSGATEDLAGITHKHTITGSFAAVPIEGCN